MRGDWSEPPSSLRASCVSFRFNGEQNHWLGWSVMRPSFVVHSLFRTKLCVTIPMRVCGCVCVPLVNFDSLVVEFCGWLVFKCFGWGCMDFHGVCSTMLTHKLTIFCYFYDAWILSRKRQWEYDEIFFYFKPHMLHVDMCKKMLEGK